jgi:hypothetical protein
MAKLMPILLRGLRKVLLLLACIAPAHALEFSAQPIDGETVVLFATGPVVQGDTERFRRQVRAHPGKQVLLFVSSGGGRIFEANDLAELIARWRIPVVIPPRGICASACFLLLAASPDRSMFPNAQIGVHSASSDAGETALSMAITTAMARAAREYGVPASIIGRMVTTTPDEMAWLTPPELRAMKIKIIESGEPPPRQAPTASPTAPPAQAPTPASAVAATPFEDDNPVFKQGLADRTAWEDWLSALPATARQGAEYWASQRSLKTPGACSSADPSYVSACEEAKRRLAAHDARRQSEPDYRRGWNAYFQPAYRADVTAKLAACRNSGGKASRATRFETGRDLNADGKPDFILDYGKFFCDTDSTSQRPYCTNNGCALGIYLSTSAGHRMQHFTANSWSVTGAAPFILVVDGAAWDANGDTLTKSTNPPPVPSTPPGEAAPPVQNSAAWQRGNADRRGWANCITKQPPGAYRTGALYWTDKRTRADAASSLCLIGPIESEAADTRYYLVGGDGINHHIYDRQAKRVLIVNRPQFEAGCMDAKKRLDRPDRLRNADAEYRRGWNAAAP